MKRFYFFGFLSLLAFDSFAQVSFKYASIYAAPLSMDLPWLMRVLTEPWVYGALLGYLGAFVTWLTLLKYAPVGPSFAASHLELVTVTLLSIWLFHEPLNVYKVVGGALIILGVLCLAKSGEKNAVKEQPQAQAP